MAGAVASNEDYLKIKLGAINRKDQKLDMKPPKENLMVTPAITMKSRFRLDDSGYFTPSPALYEREEQSAEIDDESPKSTSPRRRNYDRTNLNRRNLETNLESDQTKVIQKPNTSATTSETVPKSCCQFDIISKLRERNLWHCLSKIFSILGDRDLTAMCCVCKYWKEVCLADDLANRRRKKHLKKYRLNRENNVRTSEVAIRSDLQRQPLVLVGNFSEEPESTQDSASKTDILHQRFISVSKSLKKDESMDKCGKCGSPARVNNHTKVAKCSLPGCSNEYCISCRISCASSHQCSPVKSSIPLHELPSARGSKRRLRRLLL